MIETESTRASVSRCPACGQRLDPPGATRCPLCNFDFGDDRVTGADVTPYAKAYTQGDPGWSAMCRWVWFAGAERLKHIALMRASAAARRFAWTNTLWLALGLAVVRKVVDHHKGKVDVESTVGVGTTFKLYIPTTAS